MASHKELCRGLFKERMLPAFPHAKDRFEKYFDDAYNIIRETKPYYSVGVNDDKAFWQRSISLDLSFTLLGLKPLTILSGREEGVLRQPFMPIKRLTEIGLGIRRQVVWKCLSHLTEVYDPNLVKPILERILGSVKDIESALKKHYYGYDYEHPFSSELLWYPTARTINGKQAEYGLTIENSGLGEGPFPIRRFPYRSSFGCLVDNPDSNDIHLKERAYAAAFIEEIRENLTTVITSARTDTSRTDQTNKKISYEDVILESYTIRRTNKTGEWKEEHMVSL